MRVGEAKEISREWIRTGVGRLPGFHGAFVAGSTAYLPDDALLPANSDLDVKIVMDDPPDTGGPQKLLIHGVVLDVSYARTADVSSAELVLGSYYTAPHFAAGGVLADPTGSLAAISAVVRREYTRRTWVRRRCDHARREVEAVLDWIDPETPMHVQALMWTVALSFATHSVQVAGLYHPTHRRGPVVLHEVLAKHGNSQLHERYLRILGSDHLSPAVMHALLAACAEAFDAASPVRRTPFLMGSNVSAEARTVAIGGSAELIAEGHHREAALWILLMHTLSETALRNDAPDDVQARLTPGYLHLLDVLGTPDSTAMAIRAAEMRALIPELHKAAGEIIATNPAITD